MVQTGRWGCARLGRPSHHTGMPLTLSLLPEGGPFLGRQELLTLADSRRQPTSSNSPVLTETSCTCRIGSPDSPALQHSSRSFKQSRSVKSRPDTSDASSRPGSRAQGRLLPAKLAAGAGAAEGAGVGGADAGAEEGKGGHRGNHRAGAAVSFAVGGEASETGDVLGEPEASDTAAGDGPGERAWSGGSASTAAAGGVSSRSAARGGVRVGHKGVGIVVAAATHAGELVAQWVLL